MLDKFRDELKELNSKLDVTVELDDYWILKHKDWQVYYLWHNQCKKFIGLLNTHCNYCNEDVPKDVQIAASLMPKRDKLMMYAQMYSDHMSRLPGRTTRLKGIK